MNVFNRLAIIVLILVVMILIPLALILPEQAEYALRYAADVIRLNLQWLNGLTPVGQVGVRLLLAVMGLVVFLIGLLFLALEVIRLRRKTVQLKDGSGELLMDGVAGHLSYHIDLLPDVLRVKPTVQSKGKSVRASLYVETAPGVNVPEKSRQVRETARQVIEEQLGLQIKGPVQVQIKPIAYPKTRRSKTRAPVSAPKPIVPRPAEPAVEEMETYTPPLEIPEPPEETMPERETDTIEFKGPPS